MRKSILGLVATAALASPIVLATSAQAASPNTIPLPANPLTASVCNVLPAAPAPVTGVKWSAVVDHRALNGKVGVSATPETGYVFANGATTKAYAADACLFVAPIVEKGVPFYGAFANGTWKVGSKVTLTSGDEFQTHGGSSTSGAVTRYRLVFTPNVGFTLPSELPGDGFKVGTSAVFHVYTGPNDVSLSDGATIKKHIELPDAFETKHAVDGSVSYYSTKIRVAITNDTDRAKSVNVMYADQQDDNQVWIERGVFENWTNSQAIPAHSTKFFTFDVWYDVPVGSPSEVPDDLTLDFNVNAANA